MENLEDFRSLISMLPSELLPEIFQYLPVKDLLEASLVNLRWNKIIGNSRRLMNKIKFVFEESNHENVDILLSSTRRYSNIEIALRDIDMLQEIGNRFDLTSLSLYNCFIPIQELILALEASQESIEELVVAGGVIWLDPNPVEQVLTFPNLRVLYVDNELALQVVATCTQLKQLTIHSDEGDLGVDVIMQLLEANTWLERLALRFSGRSALFDERLHNIRFNLNELTIEGNFAFMPHFLEMQVGRLKTLAIRGGFELEVLEVIMQMQHLRSLEILPFGGGDWPLNWNELNLQENASIVELRLCNMERSEEILKAFARSLPNLKQPNA